MFVNALIVGLGGAIGSILRFLTNELFDNYLNQSVYATLTVNVIGCFLIGLFLGSTLPARDASFYFFVIGFLGSYTTMSAFSHQIILIANSNLIGAISYIMLTVFLTVLATYIGASFTK